jgi:protocatechuate 3,4-dioxygenase beta subunit
MDAAISATDFGRSCVLITNILMELMMQHENDHIDGGFAEDLAMILSRRRLLALGATGVALAACGPQDKVEANVTGQAADGTTCIKLPQETNGPFPADGTNSKAGATVNVLNKTGVIRADMRPSFGDFKDVADGVPMALEIRVVDVKNACAPLAGMLVYFWQCDAAGTYSLYERTESNNLRGAAITDGAGIARMTTIFPGCYSGRWPHTHFEVFASPETAATGQQSLLVSQFAFEKNVCESVYAGHAAYAASPAALAGLSLDSDMIFASNTKEQLAAQILKLTGEVATGFIATAVVGLA